MTENSDESSPTKNKLTEI